MRPVAAGKAPNVPVRSSNLAHRGKPCGAFLKVEEERFDGKGIRALSPDYPLPRRKPKAAATAKPAATAAPHR